MGLVAQRRFQMGKEAVRGTEVDADVVGIGSLSMTPTIQYHRPMDERKSLAEYRRSVATAHGCTLQYSGDLSYNQIPYWLSMLLRGGVVPTGENNPKEWIFQPLLTASNAHDSYTMEYGDNQQQWTVPFVVAQSMDIGIRFGEAASLSVGMFGHHPIKKVETAGVSEGDLEEVISDACKLYIDDTWAAVGTTLRSTEMGGGSIRLASGLTPVRYADGLDADGKANFSNVSENRRTHSIDLDVLMTSKGIEEVYDAWAGNEFKAVRLSFDGAEFENGHNYELEVDMFGKFTSDPGLFGAHEGENTIRMTFMSHDNGAAVPADVRVRVKNQLASL